MARAIWKDAVIAQSDTYEVVEGNVYFPSASLSMNYLRPSNHTSLCLWKGQARYYDVVVDGEVNENAAWYYPNPFKAASKIAGHVAFWHGVQVQR